jgi:carboxypeptidase Q
VKRLFAVLLCSAPLFAQDHPDLQIVSRIRNEGFRNSKVMEIASGLTDVAGPRLTGSPNLKKANEWSRDKLAEFGLTNARVEPWGPFGRGWSTEGTTVRMVSPDVQQMLGLAQAWSPSTNGPVRAKAVRVKLETKEDLEKNKGKLAGMFVLTSDPRELKPLEKVPFERYDDAALEKLAQYEIPSTSPRQRDYARRREFRRALAQFAADEKIAGIVSQGNGDFGLFDVQASGSWNEAEPAGAPSIVLAAEHYGRISRLLDAGHDVQLEIDIRAQYHTDDKNAYNTLADIPGSDKKGELVMLGAHIDSWHTGTGATDNAAGTAVMMEAARIIKSLGITPKRTIRIALWSGEEQGLLGSRAYVAEHFAKRAEPKDPEQAKLPASLRTEKGELMVKPEHAKISAYFNMDNGTGKVRGIFAQENAAAVPIFTAWLAPLHDIGATTVTMRNTPSTDHVAFDEVGIPGFQFIQDDIEYESRTHHSNWDTYERLQRDDLMQAAVVVATVVWQAANRPEMLPRKALPK